MMHGREKSDLARVAAKPANNDGRPSAELVERRAGAEGNAGQDRTRRAQDRASVSKGLDRVRHVARQRKKERFTALLHHVTPDLLRTAFFALKRQAAPGVDGLTWQAYEADLDRRIESLHERVHRGAYRALPARRGFIPKADGSQRPLAIAALEDKIVQRATAAVLNAIYEEDFLGFSYGFRPGRGAHDALDALAVGITSTKVSHILDADIRSFFDAVSQEWLLRFLNHRIGDPRILRLIRKWLNAGVLEDGVVSVGETGTGQGSVITPPTMVQTAVVLWAAIARIKGRSDAEHDVDVPVINLNAPDQKADQIPLQRPIDSRNPIANLPGEIMKPAHDQR
jgi:RNA-directed DNA polymerase